VRTSDHAWARRRMARAGVVGRICPRCGWPILQGQAWDLDHVDQPFADGGKGRLLPAHASVTVGPAPSSATPARKRNGGAVWQPSWCGRRSGSR
jgi:hypothetical protein